MGIRKLMAGSIAATALCVSAQTVHAGAPDLNLDLSVGPLQSAWNAVLSGGNETGTGIDVLNDGTLMLDYSVSWSTAANGTSTISLNFDLSNMSNVAIPIHMKSFMPITPYSGPTTLSGSVGGTTIDSNQIGVTNTPGQDFYTASVDGVAQEVLNPTVSFLPIPGFPQGDISAENFSAVPGPNAPNSDMEIDIYFTLAAGDNDQGVTTAAITSSFTIEAIPAPGALALLGLAGIAGRRRRN